MWADTFAGELLSRRVVTVVVLTPSIPVAMLTFFEEERERDAGFSICFDAAGGGIMGASASSAGGSGHGARENAV
jgi:hypothetical protein